MKKKLLTTWRITVFVFAAILFINLFNTFGTNSDAIRVGRVNIPQTYLNQAQITTNQLTYK